MQTRLNPYIGFKDNARQAMEFYTLTLSTFGEFHASEDPSEANKIMHAQLTGENGIVFMASDTPNAMPFQAGTQITMSLSGDNEKELRGYWDKLLAGGNIAMPLEKAPWGDTFGMLTDNFGIHWMVNISGMKA